MDEFYAIDEPAKAGKATSRAIRLYVDKGSLSARPCLKKEIMP